jgi:hypothetical protein
LETATIVAWSDMLELNLYAKLIAAG